MTIIGNYLHVIIHQLVCLDLSAVLVVCCMYFAIHVIVYAETASENSLGVGCDCHIAESARKVHG